MRISQQLNAAVNAQIGRELSSSHLYLSIAAYFDDRALKKLAGFFYQQSEEERAHALKFLQYLTNVDGVVEIPAVDAPKAGFLTAEEALQTAYEAELQITDHIHRLMEQALQEKDYPAAIAQLRLAVEVAPDNAAALNNLAWAQAQVGDPKAEENAARAYALAPNSSAVADTYGWILVQKGDAKRGAELLRKSVELAPNDPQRRLRLARAWIKAGDKAAARKELETAIAKAGEQPAVRSEAEKLLKEL